MSDSVGRKPTDLLEALRADFLAGREKRFWVMAGNTPSGPAEVQTTFDTHEEAVLETWGRRWHCIVDLSTRAVEVKECDSLDAIHLVPS